MPLLELPHSAGCLVCGKQNPHGLQLTFFVDDSTGEVRCDFTPTKYHSGFENISHGGAIASAVDEAMVWAATWRVKRFCLCGELTVRYRHPMSVNQPLLIVAIVEFSRHKLVETAAKIFDATNQKLLGTASAKYVPVSPEQHQQFFATMLDNPATAAAKAMLK
jgi:acyl-coenzyme A thioesterase PaaI-like protein